MHKRDSFARIRKKKGLVNVINLVRNWWEHQPCEYETRFPLYASGRVDRSTRQRTLPSLTFDLRNPFATTSANNVFTGSSSFSPSVSARNTPKHPPECTVFIPSLLPVISSCAERKPKWKWNWSCQHGHQLASEAGFSCWQYSPSASWR